MDSGIQNFEHRKLRMHHTFGRYAATNSERTQRTQQLVVQVGAHLEQNRLIQ